MLVSYFTYFTKVRAGARRYLSAIALVVLYVVKRVLVRKSQKRYGDKLKVRTKIRKLRKEN
jgi:hypothetical protein